VLEPRRASADDSGVRRPGQHAFERHKRLQRRGLTICAAALLAPAAAWALGGSPLMIVIAAGAAILAVQASERLLLQDAQNWGQGARGERVVGELLESLTADGWRVMHDVRVGQRGNIDHLVLGPGGVFTVETKSTHGRLHPSMLKQAYAQKKLVERITQRPAHALLVFSTAKLRPSTRRGVGVMAAGDLAAHLAQRPVSLAPAEVDRLATTLRAALADRA
jgi:Nuclease-related domain